MKYIIMICCLFGAVLVSQCDNPLESKYAYDTIDVYDTTVVTQTKYNYITIYDTVVVSTDTVGYGAMGVPIVRSWNKYCFDGGVCRLNVYWNKAEGAAGYYVYYKKSGDASETRTTYASPQWDSDSLCYMSPVFDKKNDGSMFYVSVASISNAGIIGKRSNWMLVIFQ